MIDPQTMHELLAAERQQTQELITSLSTGISDLSAAREGDNSDDEHDPEGSTIAFERSQADAVLASARQRLTEIAEAQDRLAAGTFGICTECGRPIAEVRLKARPYAATCVSCA